MIPRPAVTSRTSFVSAHRHIFILILHFVFLCQITRHTTPNQSTITWDVFVYSMIEVDKLMELSFNNYHNAAAALMCGTIKSVGERPHRRLEARAARDCFPTSC